MFTHIINRIELATDRIIVRLERGGIQVALEIEQRVESTEHLNVTIPAIKVRRGHQLRLIIPGNDDPSRQPVRRDEKLIALVAEAFAARKLIEDRPDMSMASIASAHGRCRTRLGRLLKLACLAPDIVTAIVEGRQPPALDAKSLLQSAPPLAWQAQRLALGLT
ncbi:hypothetical protein [Aurantiacibacter flavus]|uniref:Uncharacterized protein n=1 Tax=Aurantiacibacter flavus TaxID=3145232 RepID=A0ABV0CYF6_9SPHN